MCFRCKKSFKAGKVFLLKIQKDLRHPKSFATFVKQAQNVCDSTIATYFSTLLSSRRNATGSYTPKSNGIEDDTREKRKIRSEKLPKTNTISICGHENGMRILLSFMFFFFLHEMKATQSDFCGYPSRRVNVSLFLSHHVEAYVMPQISVT